MEISFIVVTYKRNDILKKCLESIYLQKNLPAFCELIVIDNDGNAEIPPPPDNSIALRLKRLPDNLGATGGRNAGMKLARGKYWIFLDDDAVFRDDYVAAKMFQLFEENPDCGALAGCGYSPAGDLQVNFLPYTDKEYALSLSDHANAPYYYGFVHALRASLVRQVGYYPERFFIMMEEVDLSYRIIDAGYRILYHPQIAVIHYHAAEGRATIGNKYWYRNTLNKMQLAWRLLPLPYPLTVMLVWSIATLWYSKNPLLLVKIWRDFIVLIPILRKERKIITKDAITYLHRSGGRLLY